MDRILNMVLRMFISKVMNKGMSAGMDMVARKRGNKGADQPNVSDPNASKRAKDMMKVTRRVSKF